MPERSRILKVRKAKATAARRGPAAGAVPPVETEDELFGTEV